LSISSSFTMSAIMVPSLLWLLFVRFAASDSAATAAVAVSADEVPETCSAETKSCESDAVPFNEALATTTVTLNDGTKIPIVGLGTWVSSRTQRNYEYWEGTELLTTDKSGKMPDEEREKDLREEREFKDAVITGIKAGYRHIDSAIVYRTEKVIGEALQELYASSDIDVKREDIWITTKVPRGYRDMKQVEEGIETSLRLFQTEYIDLYLIHSPHTDVKEEGKKGSDVLDIYRMLLDYKKQGKIKSVGVSNFGIDHLRTIEAAGLPLPSMNQIEVSVFLVEEELIAFCKEKGIVIEAYSPIAQAHDIARNNELLQELAAKYGERLGKTLNFAHIMIRWCIDKGFVVLPKSVTPSRIIANGDVFDFEIEEEDLKRLDALKEEKYRICWNPLDIEWDVVELNDE